jgi:hypothetical protein
MDQTLYLYINNSSDTLIHYWLVLQILQIIHDLLPMLLLLSLAIYFNFKNINIFDISYLNTNPKNLIK